MTSEKASWLPKLWTIEVIVAGHRIELYSVGQPSVRMAGSARDISISSSPGLLNKNDALVELNYMPFEPAACALPFIDLKAVEALWWRPTSKKHTEWLVEKARQMTELADEGKDERCPQTSEGATPFVTSVEPYMAQVAPEHGTYLRTYSNLDTSIRIHHCCRDDQHLLLVEKDVGPSVADAQALAQTVEARFPRLVFEVVYFPNL